MLGLSHPRTILFCNRHVIEFSLFYDIFEGLEDVTVNAVDGWVDLLLDLMWVTGVSEHSALWLIAKLLLEDVLHQKLKFFGAHIFLQLRGQFLEELLFFHLELYQFMGPETVDALEWLDVVGQVQHGGSSSSSIYINIPVKNLARNRELELLSRIWGWNWKKV